MAIWTPKIAGYNIIPIKIPTLVSPETLSSNLENGLNFTRTDQKLKNAVRNLLGSSTHLNHFANVFQKTHQKYYFKNQKKDIKKELDTLTVTIGKIFQLLIKKALENETKTKNQKQILQKQKRNKYKEPQLFNITVT